MWLVGCVACGDGRPVAAIVDDAGGSGATDATFPVAAPDAGAPGNGAGEGGVIRDAGATALAACEPVQGPACDLVLQNCPPTSAGGMQQCITQAAAGGGFTTACLPVQVSQHLQKGRACCPSADPTLNPCDFPLECIGDGTASCDAGVLPGRCSPHCCGGDAGDDAVCGSSIPEGYPGHCDVTIVDPSGASLFNACTYELGCQPFQRKPCPVGELCQIIDPTGTATCAQPYTPDGGPLPGEGQPCVALNNCQDGLACLDNGNNTSSCYVMCLSPAAAPPFDAGVLDGGPGYGGCPAGERCSIAVSGFPAWISFCGP
jgi:hypothetical protein